MLSPSLIFLCTGILPEHLEKLMDTCSGKKLELTKALENSMLLQRAKFKAKYNSAREKVLSFHERNLYLHNMRVKIEKEYLA